MKKLKNWRNKKMYKDIRGFIISLGLNRLFGGKKSLENF